MNNANNSNLLDHSNTLDTLSDSTTGLPIKKEFITPKLTFVQPTLTKQGNLSAVTGFFISVTPPSG